MTTNGDNKQITMDAEAIRQTLGLWEVRENMARLNSMPSVADAIVQCRKDLLAFMARDNEPNGQD